MPLVGALNRSLSLSSLNAQSRNPGVVFGAIKPSPSRTAHRRKMGRLLGQWSGHETVFAQPRAQCFRTRHPSDAAAIEGYAAVRADGAPRAKLTPSRHSPERFSLYLLAAS